ncbi:MAG: hypothetical protein J6M17_14135, partial [Ruminococcus sp.]|nr:hypothetical protein [Ruminococcus sp.]
MKRPTRTLSRMISAAAAVMTAGSPLTAFAGQQLGQTDFEDGAGLPWHICESATGKMDFEIDDGVYKITILDPG